MKDAKKVQHCARTIYPNIYSSAFFIFASPDQDPDRPRENASGLKPPCIGDCTSLCVVVLMTPVLPERSWSLFNGFASSEVARDLLIISYSNLNVPMVLLGFALNEFLFSPKYICVR
ncbi:hypothetical protein AVEN_87420-1 [Araneus ventricosus]|uniref:Uncharacterized protein n=1 Tax=Araneus ventricosus TaxID=182803 RepID=A0A4Y2UXL3_ARAVE|nr:hypothetical protein AVEN_87420-1 [Araneus ventricosus]